MIRPMSQAGPPGVSASRPRTAPTSRPELRTTHVDQVRIHSVTSSRDSCRAGMSARLSLASASCTQQARWSVNSSPASPGVAGTGAHALAAALGCSRSGRRCAVRRRACSSRQAATRAEVVEVSLGDYVLNGGEVAAVAVTEAVVRLLPGFMGNAESLVEESHADGLLEYPVYTKPASWNGRDVPEVLLSGDHARVREWRLRRSQAADEGA